MSVSNRTKWVRKIQLKTFAKFSSEKKICTVLPNGAPRENSRIAAQATQPLINLAAFDRLSTQPQILRQIIQIYLDITPDTLEEIKAGVAGGDNEQVAQAAHSLKGSSAELGAEQLAELCHQLCVEAKAENRASVERLATEVSHCCRETRTAMNALDLG